MNDTLQRYDRELEAKWQNRNDRFKEEQYKPSEGASAVIAVICLCGIGLAAFVCFMNWAIPLVRVVKK